MRRCPSPSRCPTTVRAPAKLSIETSPPAGEGGRRIHEDHGKVTRHALDGLGRGLVGRPSTIRPSTRPDMAPAAATNSTGLACELEMSSCIVCARASWSIPRNDFREELPVEVGAGRRNACVRLVVRVRAALFGPVVQLQRGLPNLAGGRLADERAGVEDPRGRSRSTRPRARPRPGSSTSCCLPVAYVHWAPGVHPARRRQSMPGMARNAADRESDVNVWQ